MTPEKYTIYNVVSQRQEIFEFLPQLTAMDLQFGREFTGNPQYVHPWPLAQRINDLHTFILIHNSSGHLIGHSGLGISDPKKNGWDLTMSFVIKEERGQGIWARTLPLREEIGLAHGAQSFTTWPHNPFMLPTLERRGYRRVNPRSSLFRLIVG